MSNLKLFAVSVLTGDVARPDTFRMSMGFRTVANQEQAVASVVARHYVDHRCGEDLITTIAGEVPRDLVAHVLAELDKPPPAEPQKVVALVPPEPPTTAA